jgi:cytochrome b
MAEGNSKYIKVWDILVRVFHWSLVLFFAIAYLTEGDWISVHSYAGYTIFLLVIFRIVWGVIGTTHARFSNFVVSPMRAVDYLKDELSGDAKHYLGHNPAGGLMIIVLIISLLITVITGASIIATEGDGPLAMTFIASWSGELLEEVHEFFTTIILLLVILHIGGVIFSSLLQEENLVKAMFTGKKQINHNDKK